MTILRESIDRFASEEIEIIIIDNSSRPVWEHHPFSCTHEVHHVHMKKNIGHGEGLNVGSYMSSSPYTMFLDVDCHFLRKRWEEDFIYQMDRHDVVAGRGVPQKPIRPACMFMKTEVAKKYDWRATPGYKGHRVTPDGYDVAIKAYYDMDRDGVSLGLLDSKPSRYETLSGEEWYVDGVPYVYHHWHGTHLSERQIDFPDNDLQTDKDLLFRQIPWRLANEMI